MQRKIDRAIKKILYSFLKWTLFANRNCEMLQISINSDSTCLNYSSTHEFSLGLGTDLY
jgi:hypothetical protein